MTVSPAHRHWPWLLGALTLTAVKLWLTRGQDVYAIGNAGHDDRLFIELARHLIAGEWLGPYNELTLAKGPFYPLFIAAAHALSVPLFLAQQIFYAMACGLFVRALQPALVAGARFAIYTLLLANPMTWDAGTMGRVLRQQVYGPLALILLAGLVALHLRRHESTRRQAPWAVLLGLAGAAFYLTREEVIWLAPSAALLGGAFLLGSWKISRFTAGRAAGTLLLATLVGAGPILLVCARNLSHYGWFGTCEFRAPQFQAAYGSLLRVRVGPELPYVPVTRQAREAIAAVSPAFAELQHELDAGLARGWAGASEFFTHLPPDEGQIGGGWLIWAIRAAAAQAGHHHSAREAMAFYDRLAREVNQACADGRLPAGPPRAGFLPPWQESRAEVFVHASADFADFFVRFSRFSARASASSGQPEELQLFRDITGERMSLTESERAAGEAPTPINTWKTEMLQSTGKVLRVFFFWSFVLAQLAALGRVFPALGRRQWSFPLTIAAAAWGACAASLLMHALIEATSFPVFTISSFAPIYPLLLVFIAAAFWDVISSLACPATLPAEAVPRRQLTPPARPSPAFAHGIGSGSWPWIAGGVALLPFLIWYRSFAELFWFGDDLFLLDQIAMMGLREWILRVFSENFVPLFKLLWGGAALGFGGSYLAMLSLLWLTHALNAFLLCRLMQCARFPWLATAFTLVLFTLSPINLETLGWSVQWSAVLATSFLLLGLWWHEAHCDLQSAMRWRLYLPLGLCAALSACSFSRGVLTGPVLALALLLSVLPGGQLLPVLRRLPAAILCLLPSLVVAAAIMHFSSGNHQALAGHWGEIGRFAASYFFLNPAHLLLGGTSLGVLTLLALGIAKISIVWGALAWSSGRVRQLLLLLLAYDMGNALLIGIGRYHTGFLAAMSSRYQYSSLIATLPFAGILLSACFGHLRSLRLHRWAGACLIVGLAGYSLVGWPRALSEFIGWRGTDLRALLAAPPTTDPAAKVPALEYMHVERAKALQRTFNLH